MAEKRSVELVKAPSIVLVAHTVINADGLRDWAAAHGLEETLDDDSTPLGIIDRDVEQGAYENSLDALPEFGGRFCYRSFKKGRNREDYLANIVKDAHGNVLEHSVVSFAVSGVSRSFSHELVRHRAGAVPSQESQRYVDAKDIRFVVPPALLLINDDYSRTQALYEFHNCCSDALCNYENLRDVLEMELSSPMEGSGVKFDTMAKKRALEAARSLLPNAAETRLIWTGNLRAMRQICSVRGSRFADLEIRRVAVEFTKQLKVAAPLTFADFSIVDGPDGLPEVHTPHPKI
jgi:thymidylate synthase (FAD)